MIFKVLTQQGKTYSDEIEYAVLKSENGEMAILRDHIPIIVQIGEGYVKFVGKQSETFLVVEQAVVEFSDNILTVLALEAQIGSTFEKAKHAFDDMKKLKLEFTKKENIDFSKQERELKENITKSKAAHL
jgi:F-type H+-transporting ATPase subunit epsilon